MKKVFKKPILFTIKVPDGFIYDIISMKNPAENRIEVTWIEYLKDKKAPR